MRYIITTPHQLNTLAHCSTVCLLFCSLPGLGKCAIMRSVGEPRRNQPIWLGNGTISALVPFTLNKCTFESLNQLLQNDNEAPMPEMNSYRGTLGVSILVCLLSYLC